MIEFLKDLERKAQVDEKYEEWLDKGIQLANAIKDKVTTVDTAKVNEVLSALSGKELTGYEAEYWRTTPVEETNIKIGYLGRAIATLTTQSVEGDFKTKTYQVSIKLQDKLGTSDFLTVHAGTGVGREWQEWLKFDEVTAEVAVQCVGSPQRIATGYEIRVKPAQALTYTFNLERTEFHR